MVRDIPALLLLLMGVVLGLAITWPILADDGLQTALSDATGLTLRSTATIAVRPAAAVGPDRSTTSEDLRVTHNIRDALQRAVMNSDPEDIRIQTRKGAVTLSGTIKDASERQLVEALVRGTPGAMTLVDQLQIP